MRGGGLGVIGWLRKWAQRLEPPAAEMGESVHMNEAVRKSVRVRVRGRVQGVWFRGWTQMTAKSFGVTGWVRNRYDGSVEAIFAGPETAVDLMVEACRKGPPSAIVHEFRVEPAPDPGLSRFDVWPTG